MKVQPGSCATVLPALPAGQQTTAAKIPITGKQNSKEICLYVLLFWNKYV